MHQAGLELKEPLASASRVPRHTSLGLGILSAQGSCGDGSVGEMFTA